MTVLAASFPRQMPQKKQTWILLDFAKRMTARPKARSVADRKLVTYKSLEDDRLHVGHDACPHRGAALHRGTVRGDGIVCPYHGLSICPGKNTDRYLTHAETAGTVWLDVASLGYLADDEEHPLEQAPPECPEFTDPAYRTIEYSRTVRTNPVLMAENTLDWLHLGSVHRFTLVKGDPVVTVKQTGTHGVATYEYTGDLFDLTVENEYWIPFTTSLRFHFKSKATGTVTKPLLLWFSLTPLEGDMCELNLRISRTELTWFPMFTDQLFKLIDELPLFEDLEVVATVDPREWSANRLTRADGFVKAYREAMQTHCAELLKKYVF
jgi:phenylpropionate dioxygenase-like ring-hydroxylating dioxygenase large terminal subunit